MNDEPMTQQQRDEERQRGIIRLELLPGDEPPTFTDCHFTTPPVVVIQGEPTYEIAPDVTMEVRDADEEEGEDDAPSGR